MLWMAGNTASAPSTEGKVDQACAGHRGNSCRTPTRGSLKSLSTLPLTQTLTLLLRLSAGADRVTAPPVCPWEIRGMALPAPDRSLRRRERSGHRPSLWGARVSYKGSLMSEEAARRDKSSLGRMHLSNVLLPTDALNQPALASEAKIPQTPQSGGRQRAFLGRAAGTRGSADECPQHQLPGAQSPRTRACPLAESRMRSRGLLDQFQRCFSAWLS